MPELTGPEQLAKIAPAGYYIALRIGFAFPMEEVNALPSDWVEHYTAQSFMLFDPVVHWVYSTSGSVRWSEIAHDDPRKVMVQARAFGLRYGAAVSCHDREGEGQRSFAWFARSDREFADLELKVLHAFLIRRHTEMAPPTSLTPAELEALGRIRDGMRLKEIAHEVGVTEGAVKLRLRNAKRKLDAKTASQAAALASQYGLI